MKRYLLFAGFAHDAIGGWNDLVRDGDTVEDLRPAESSSFDWWHVVDIETGKQVAGCGADGGIYAGDEGRVRAVDRYPNGTTPTVTFPGGSIASAVIANGQVIAVTLTAPPNR